MKEFQQNRCISQAAEEVSGLCVDVAGEAAKARFTVTKG
jgi:hypothetical protein